MINLPVPTEANLDEPSLSGNPVARYNQLANH